MLPGRPLRKKVSLKSLAKVKGVFFAGWGAVARAGAGAAGGAQNHLSTQWEALWGG
ncbi:MAG: hypothetical protein AB1815_10310 [Bacillota bacterium]